MNKEKGWFLVWFEPNEAGTACGASRHAYYKSADKAANKLLQIVANYNAKQPVGATPYGVMDFEGVFTLKHPDGSSVLLEDLPCYVSDEWLAANSEAVI